MRKNPQPVVAGGLEFPSWPSAHHAKPTFVKHGGET